MRRIACLVAAATLSPAALANPQLAREILDAIVAIDSTHAHGSTQVAQVLQKRLREAGFAGEDVQLLAPRPDKGNLIVRLRGSGKAKPILFIAHLDVVEADPADWSTPPFQVTEKDGVLYGRGVIDIKNEVAILVADLIRLRREKYVPSRDVIVALTSDEEGGGDLNGVEWLLANRRDLIEAEFVINPDSGGGDLDQGRRTLLRFQTGEKTYATFHLETTSPGGHSSMPPRENAIYQLTAGLDRLARFEFPVKLNDTTQAFFARRAALEQDPKIAADLKAVGQGIIDTPAVQRLSATPLYNATLRTTCVTTVLRAGEAEAALPQRAQATVQCRLLPGESVSDAQATLIKVIADAGIEVSAIDNPTTAPGSPLRQDVLRAVERVTAELWPGVPVVPAMDPWSSDSFYLRRAGIPSYGVSGVFTDQDSNGAHGRDEHVGVQAFGEGVEFTYRLIKALTR